jgi:hypothetical protein
MTAALDLTDEQYELADRIEAALEAAGPDGLTPSRIARKAHADYHETCDVLFWMVAHQYAHTSGNGAWTHYHAGRNR